jgi:DNA-binding MarR family transcriptional regulator
MEYQRVSSDEGKQVANLLLTLLRRLTMAEDDPVAEVPLAQLRLCNVLMGGPRPMSEISREIGTSLSAVTQIADRLERSGLIQRIPRGDDRRIRCLQLTERGDEMMRLHDERRVGRMSRVLEQLRPEERQAVIATFEMLVRAAGAARGPETDPARNHLHHATSKVLL